MGEVIKHVEEPILLLVKVRNLLTLIGSAFISNSAIIDHIHLFISVDGIRVKLRQTGFHIMHKQVQFAENLSEEQDLKLQVALMFASFGSLAGH